MSKFKLTKTTLVDKKLLKKYQFLVKKIFKETFTVANGTLVPRVKELLKSKNKILALTKKHPTPFYLIDRFGLAKSITEYLNAFKKSLPQTKHFYAMKLNSHPYLIKSVIKNGFGIDASSGREVEIALRSKAKQILFSGPGKTDTELQLALKNSSKIIVNLDSFGELDRLGKLTNKAKIKVRAGVRIFTKYHGIWIKFGIPLSELKKFWLLAKKYPYLELSGIQFHMSFIPDQVLYQSIIKEVGEYLKNNFNAPMLADLKFIDFGGGFRPYFSEGYYPREFAQGAIIREINKHYNLQPQFKDKYYLTESIPMADYAQGIAVAINKYIKPLGNFEYYTEPGRIICNNSMHIVLRVVDVKQKGKAILDGGINIVGWERFEWDYFPLINLTRPALKEIDFQLYGSLCLPDDMWGYYCFAKDVKPGDIILVPYQGAMTYALAQNFIKPIPEIYYL